MNHEESKIQAAVVQKLQEMGVYCHSIPNEVGNRSKLETMRLISMGLRSGVADLLVWWKTGVGYLEMKTN